MTSAASARTASAISACRTCSTSVDIIVGSFSKTFAANGGFIAVKTRAAAEYLKYYSATQTFSNALSPVQAAAVCAAFRIVRSAEGQQAPPAADEQHPLSAQGERRASAWKSLGDPSAIVPVRVGAEGLARIASRNLVELGAIANLVEYPAVPQGGARFRVQVMADHKNEEIDIFVKTMLECHALRGPRVQVLSRGRVRRCHRRQAGTTTSPPPNSRGTSGRGACRIPGLAPGTARSLRRSRSAV